MTRTVLALILPFAAALTQTAPVTNLRAFGHNWTVRNADDWKIRKDGETEVLRLEIPREPLPGPRRPIQFALSDMPDARQATVEADIQPLKRSVIIVYAYQDEAHFNYAHLSTDTGLAQPVHNGVFHVFGGERVRISSQAGPASFPAIDRWYHVKLVFNGTTGTVDVSVDNQSIPALHAVDLSLTHGKVGLGSFDETGEFKNVKMTGVFQSLLPPLRF